MWCTLWLLVADALPEFLIADELPSHQQQGVLQVT